MCHGLPRCGTVIAATHGSGDMGLRDNRRDGVTASERFANRHDVRFDPEKLRREPGLRAVGDSTEAGLNLVDDQQRIMLVAHGANPLGELGARRPNSGLLTLDKFKDDGSCGAFLEYGPDGIEVAELGEVDPGDIIQSKRGSIGRVVSYRHRTVGAAVKSTLEGDDSCVAGFGGRGE